MEAELQPMCPKCDSPEWFPGAACFACGWEGSAAEAYSAMRKRMEELEAENARLRERLSLYERTHGHGWGEKLDTVEANLDEARAQLAAIRAVGPFVLRTTPTRRTYLRTEESTVLSKDDMRRALEAANGTA